MEKVLINTSLLTLCIYDKKEVVINVEIEFLKI